MSEPTDELAGLWLWFGEQQFRGYSPIYERIAAAVAADGDVLAMHHAAPPEAHLPLVPLAAVRYLLLDGLAHPLGDVYAGRSDADPGPLFLDVWRHHRDEVCELMATRRVQTNDCGRSALIGPALTWAAHERRGPFTLIDVGTSAGINLRCDRYRIDYGSYGATGPVDSTVRIDCAVVAGSPPIAERLPELAERLGIDLSPIDLTDPNDARWLLACVWPDTGRADRVAASISLVQHDPPSIVAGRANDVLPDLLAGLPDDMTAIVMTTWAFGYFSPDERSAFLELLKDASRRRPIVWISAESAGVVEALSAVDSNPEKDELLGALLFDDGAVTTRPLAHVHAHGKWLAWL